MGWLVGCLLGPTGTWAEPAPDRDELDAALRQVNALLADHPWFVAPLGPLVAVLVVDGRHMITGDYYPEHDRDGLWWIADVADLRPEVRLHPTLKLPDAQFIQCRTVGPLRAQRDGRCWSFEDYGDGPHADGRVWFVAEPEISEMIRAAIEDVIVLAQAREQAIR